MTTYDYWTSTRIRIAASALDADIFHPGKTPGQSPETGELDSTRVDTFWTGWDDDAWWDEIPF